MAEPIIIQFWLVAELIIQYFNSGSIANHDAALVAELIIMQFC